MERRASMSSSCSSTASSKTSCCYTDPIFAEICSFIEVFGNMLGMGLNSFRFSELQRMIEARKRVSIPRKLMKLHLNLLVKYYRRVVSPSTWERHLARFAQKIGLIDQAKDIQENGYRHSKVQTKLQVLKYLLEAQFECNSKFKKKVKNIDGDLIRRNPLGRDQNGHFYWCQVDSEANVRVQREDLDKSSWETLTTSREGLNRLIEKLKTEIS